MKTTTRVPREHLAKRRDIAKEKFIQALSTGVTVAEAAEIAGVGHRTVHHWREDKEFAALWQEAYDRGTAVYEAEARRRALHGVPRPVFQGGRRVGTVRDFSDRLLEVKLRARAPERYRDRTEHTGPDGKGIPLTGKIEIELVKPKARRE